MDEELQDILEEYKQSTVDLLTKTNQLRPRPEVLPETPLTMLFYITYLLNGGGGGASGDVTVVDSLPAGDNNIGNVDVESLPVSFNTGASDSTTQRTVTASNSPEVTTLSSINNKTTAIASFAARLTDGTSFYQSLSEGTDITGAAMPAGGSGGRGWLSAIWSRLATAVGLPGDTAATTDTGSFNLNQFFQRLLSAKLPSTLGAKTAANSFAVIPSSDYQAIAIGNVAAGAADSGPPVKIGGKFNTTRPNYTDGQRGDAQITARGGILSDYEDYISATGSIGAADINNASPVAGNNGQLILGNAPTANSAVAILGSGNSSFAIQIDGTFVGTLQFERSLDGGLTYTSVGAFAAGTRFTTQTTTLPGRFHGNSSSSTAIRVRAIAWTSGTATVSILLGQGTGTVTIGNPVTTLSLFNQFAAEAQLTAPGSTQSLDVTAYRNIRCQFEVANIGSAVVVVRLEGSNDGTRWDNLDASNADKTVTANGIYSFLLQNVPLHRIRFTFVSESGGTAATIDVRFVSN